MQSDEENNIEETEAEQDDDDGGGVCGANECCGMGQKEAAFGVGGLMVMFAIGCAIVITMQEQ